MWTIFNSEGKGIANCDLQANDDDLALRGERAVFHQEVISLDEIMLKDNKVKRKPLVVLSAKVAQGTATISVNCDDVDILELPLKIDDVCVLKPIGNFVINGETNVHVLIDFERELFRGNCLEVIL